MLTLGLPGVVTLPERAAAPNAQAALWSQMWVQSLPLGLPTFAQVVSTRTGAYTVLPILDRRVAVSAQDWVFENILPSRPRSTPPAGGRGNNPGGGGGGQGGGNHGHNTKQKDAASRFAGLSQGWVQSPLALYLLPANPPPKPFHQDDWPWPRGKQPLVQDWQTQRLNGLPTANTAPNAQYDWPLPVTRRLPTQFWSQSPTVQVTVTPFAQTDWPVPKGKQPPVAYWTWKARADGVPYVVNTIQFYQLVFMQADAVAVAAEMDQAQVVNLTALHQPTYELVFAQADAVVAQAEMDANPVVVFAPFV